MSKNVRQAVYTALFLLNGVAMVCVQQNLLPAHYVSIAAGVSLVTASLLPKFAADDPKEEK